MLILNDSCLIGMTTDLCALMAECLSFNKEDRPYLVNVLGRLDDLLVLEQEATNAISAAALRISVPRDGSDVESTAGTASGGRDSRED